MEQARKLSVERWDILDTFRGVAILVLPLAHFTQIFFNRDVGHPTDPRLAALLYWTLTGKARSALFLIFGIGLVYLTRNRGSSFGSILLLVWRFYVLCVLATVYNYFLFRHTIWGAFAGLGCILVWFLGLRKRWPLALICAPAMYIQLLYFNGRVNHICADVAQHVLRLNGLLNFHEMMRSSDDFRDWTTLHAPLYIAHAVVGIGIARWRLWNAASFRELAPRIGIALIAIGYIFTSDATNIGYDAAASGIGWDYICLLVACGWFLFAQCWPPILSKPLHAVFSPVGKMPMTAYALGTAILCYGSGAWNRMYGLEETSTSRIFTEHQALNYACCTVVAVQVVCHIWMRIFRQGPIEALWRLCSLDFIGRKLAAREIDRSEHPSTASA